MVTELVGDLLSIKSMILTLIAGFYFIAPPFSLIFLKTHISSLKQGD